MNKVITINLNGNSYQLEENGYEALRAYLETAARRLEGNPDRDEIVADIEQAIADKFRARLDAYKTVVATKEIEKVIEEMGPVEDGSAVEDGAAAPGARGETAAAPGDPPPAKRLYRIKQGAKIAGVCNGLAVYLDLDVTLIRAVLTVLTVVAFLTHGAGILFVLAYFLTAFIVPKAKTPAEKAAAYGGSSTAQEFIRRAKAGYYEGMKSLHGKREHREWKRKFKQEMRGWRRDFQREMHDSAEKWSRQWQQPWAPRPVSVLGLCLVLPILALINVVIGVIWIVAIISLLATGAVFGILPLFGLHLWVAVLFLILSYQLVVWPLKSLRRACRWEGAYGRGPLHPLAALGEAVVWLGFLLVLVWLASRHTPEIHAALQQLSLAAHQGVDALRRCWHRR